MTMIEFIGTITTILAVSGVVLNNRHRIECFYLWLVSNLLSAVIHFQTETYSLMVRDLIFLALSIERIWVWKRTDARREKQEVLWVSGPCPDRNIKLPPGTISVWLQPADPPSPAMLPLKDVFHDAY
jgi:nicotinamide riboside transporter PnuC